MFCASCNGNVVRQGGGAPSAAAAQVVSPLPQVPDVPPRRAAPVKSRSDIASERLGSKLLSGWRMLGDSCNCGVPYMSARGSDRKCVRDCAIAAAAATAASVALGVRHGTTMFVRAF
jgi:hypothetical protein